MARTVARQYGRSNASEFGEKRADNSETYSDLH